MNLIHEVVADRAVYNPAGFLIGYVKLAITLQGWMTVYIYDPDSYPILNEDGRQVNHGSVRGALEAFGHLGL